MQATDGYHMLFRGRTGSKAFCIPSTTYSGAVVRLTSLRRHVASPPPLASKEAVRQLHDTPQQSRSSSSQSTSRRARKLTGDGRCPHRCLSFLQLYGRRYCRREGSRDNDRGRSKEKPKGSHNLLRILCGPFGSRLRHQTTLLNFIVDKFGLERKTRRRRRKQNKLKNEKRRTCFSVKQTTVVYRRGIWYIRNGLICPPATRRNKPRFRQRFSLSGTFHRLRRTRDCLRVPTEITAVGAVLYDKKKISKRNRSSWRRDPGRYRHIRLV